MKDKNNGFSTEGLRDSAVFEGTDSTRVTFARTENYYLTRNHQPKNDGHGLTKSDRTVA